MALNATKVVMPKSGTKQAEIEVGNYPARVAQVIDMGVHHLSKWDGSQYVIDTDKAPMPHIMITYELVTEFMKDANGDDVEDKPRWISETWPFYTLKSDKATTTQRYMALDPKVSKGGDWSQMPNAPCTVTIGHNNKGRAKVGNVSPPMKGYPIAELKNPPKFFDLSAPDLEIFGSLPEWVQTRIKESLDFPGSRLEEALGGKPIATPKYEEPPMSEEGEDAPW